MLTQIPTPDSFDSWNGFGILKKNIEWKNRIFLHMYIHLVDKHNYRARNFHFRLWITRLSVNRYLGITEIQGSSEEREARRGRGRYCHLPGSISGSISV